MEKLFMVVSLAIMLCFIFCCFYDKWDAVDHAMDITEIAAAEAAAEKTEAAAEKMEMKKRAKIEFEVMKAQAEVEEQNKALVRRSMELYDEGNFTERDKMFSPNAVIHAPGGAGYGVKDYREHFGSKFYTAFPDLKHTIEDIIAEGDKVVLRLTDYGIHKGEFLGIPPTEKEIHWPVTSIYRLSEGIIQEVWIEFDILGLMQQLSTEHKPKEAKK